MTEIDANRVRRGMTVGEVELQVGGGTDITKNGPVNTPHRPYFWPPRTSKDKIMQWGKDDRVLFVRFVNGRAEEISISDLKTPDSLRPTAEQKQKDSERASRIEFVNMLLRQLAKDNGRLPPSIEDASKDVRRELKRYFEEIRDGKIIVRWGRDVDDLLIAYEAEVPEKGGWIISRGSTRDVSESEFARLLGLSP